LDKDCFADFVHIFYSSHFSIIAYIDISENISMGHHSCRFAAKTSCLAEKTRDLDGFGGNPGF
jgi:hypothetical protein